MEKLRRLPLATRLALIAALAGMLSLLALWAGLNSVLRDPAATEALRSGLIPSGLAFAGGLQIVTVPLNVLGVGLAALDLVRRRGEPQLVTLAIIANAAVLFLLSMTMAVSIGPR